MNVVVNGLMTNYQKVGKGKTLVCLPGWGDTIASFSKLIDDLKDDYTVYALDLPGFGATQAPNRAWGLSDYAQFVADWLKKIKAPEVYGLIAHSYGGATSVIGLGKGFLESEKLVLVASAGIRDKNSLKKAFLKTLAKIGKLPLYLLPARTRAKLRKKVYKSIGSDMLLLPHMEATFKKIIKEDVRNSAASIKIPTLLIYGTEDPKTPTSDGKLLHKAITGSRLEIINGGNHFLHQDHPDGIAKLIRHFLKEKS